MGEHTPNGGSVKDYRTLLLKIVERIENDVRDTKSDVSVIRTHDIPAIQVEIAEIRTANTIKASLYGVAGGFIPALGLLIYWLVSQ